MEKDYNDFGEEVLRAGFILILEHRSAAFMVAAKAMAAGEKMYPHEESGRMNAINWELSKLFPGHFGPCDFGIFCDNFLNGKLPYNITFEDFMDYVRYKKGF